ncbi:sugar phosphate isomerase family [Sediminispirochaeta bajacaliforniensis]|uniref:hypothetical protein n=1 Tax=Sediminispirochaeta bajacaliforniensis TaxID=148 RepID=UPI0003718C6E|nr:hypothetical protein [Sediminispirochaeta bajacaliforniensis]
MITHRVKRQDLIMALFVLFSSEYDRQSHESILDIVIPISEVKAYIEKRFRVSYSGSSWIYTQIHNYEDEIGYRLFDKERTDKDEYALRLHRSMLAFAQKRHLYINQKIKVSNALYDMILHRSDSRQYAETSAPTIKLLIDAGSTVYHLADIIANHSSESSIYYEVFTHNISIIERFLEPHVKTEQITVRTPAGEVDPVTNSILGDDISLYKGPTFDMIIQGTSFLFDGTVGVEQERESRVKQKILKETQGPKILILTGHEIRTEPPEKSQFPFGKLTDFDLLVVPFNARSKAKNLNAMLERYESVLKPEIMNWNYRIYHIQ